MATKYVCDRCHAESTSRTDIFSVTIPILIGDIRGDRDYAKEVSNHEKDLCKPCLRMVEGLVKTIFVAGSGR